MTPNPVTTVGQATENVNKLTHTHFHFQFMNFHIQNIFPLIGELHQPILIHIYNTVTQVSEASEVILQCVAEKF